GNPQNEIARFRAIEPTIPAISNAAASEKLTPAQSLRALFTDDRIITKRDARFSGKADIAGSRRHVGL
ncbi:MAG: hypothetical protein WA832_23330, partial [Bradyrhizobium sp.]|uniref:hypothetical protein n=1 Tax=Bradyrhizobium sp. TaxID=376 RepID=UPI003C79C3F8